MNGIIILDGPDACGKTTLQKYFVEHHKAVPIHLTYNKEVGPVMFNYQTTAMLQAIGLSKDNLVIVDRHWMSEAIYAKVFRGGSPWPHMGRMMDRVWMKHAAIYILCLPNSIEQTVKRHHENLDPSHPYDDEKFTKLLQEFLYLWEGKPQTIGINDLREPPAESLDYASQIAHDGGLLVRRPYDAIAYTIEGNGDNLGWFTNMVLEKLHLHQVTQYDSALDPNNQNILGHLSTATHLIVGDRVNQKDNEFAWPFYEYRNCSLFLAECMAKIVVDETKLMWTNTYDEQGRESDTIVELTRKHGLKPIAFGKVAEEYLCKNGIFRYMYCHHPQFAHRFGKEEQFMVQLVEAIE